MSGTSTNNVSVDISCITPAAGSILVNQYALQHDRKCLPTIKRRAQKRGQISDFWHKFTIITDKTCEKEYRKNYILTLITDVVHPYDLLPVYVKEQDGNLEFLAKNCLAAIIKLCEVFLELKNPMERRKPFIVVIVVDVCTTKQVPNVHTEPNIIDVLERRTKDGVLDLSNFAEDPSLTTFCPLSQHKVLIYIISLLMRPRRKPQVIKKLLLSNNNIQTLPRLDSFNLKQFEAIDLGDNKMHKMEDLVPLKDWSNLTWLRLEGNPLCRSFDTGMTYFLYVKAICNKLQTLDLKTLFNGTFYQKHRNFLCDPKGFDFANQFVQQFYTYFDESPRNNIASFYHEKAVFSLTHRPTNQPTSAGHEVMAKMIGRSRNIMIVDAKPSMLQVGRENIKEEFQKYVPYNLKHNPYSFAVDLMQYSKTRAVICVTGMFQINPVAFLNEEVFCGFNRSFVLTSSDGGTEWLITNDQWQIFSPLNRLAASKLKPWPDRNPQPFPLAKKDEDMEMLVQTFRHITGTTYTTSKAFLTIYEWNLQLALQTFVDAHKNAEISDDCFENIEERDAPANSSNNSDSDDDVILVESDILPSITTLAISEPHLPVLSNPKAHQMSKRAKRKNQRLYIAAKKASALRKRVS